MFAAALIPSVGAAQAPTLRATSAQHEASARILKSRTDGSPASTDESRKVDGVKLGAIVGGGTMFGIGMFASLAFGDVDGPFSGEALRAVAVVTLAGAFVGAVIGAFIG